MKMLHRWLVFTVLMCLSMISAGCSGGGTTPDTRSPAQYFRDRQKATMTPHGKIKMDTVIEDKDGMIQYQTTDDGKTWRVKPTKRDDGTYEFNTPIEVK